MDDLRPLLLPFEKGYLDWPEAPVLFVNAVDCAALPGTVIAQQYFKSFARDATAQIPAGHFDLVLVRGSKSCEETRYYIALALDRLNNGGVIVAAAANDAGGRRLQQEMEEAGLCAQSISKYKAQIVWAVATGQKKPDWISAGEMQPVLGGRYMSQPGIYGWDKIDVGSALLCDFLPDNLHGAGADFGCGYGFLADNILANCPAIKTFFCVDADYRALQSCRENTASFTDVEKDFIWSDLTVPQSSLPPLDFIVMNPPFHEGKQVKISVGADFIKTASDSLKKGGALYMVANAYLPYETILKTCFSSCDKLAENKGFKVFHAKK